MNIIVKTAEGCIVVRPDTTWEKDNEDFFPPDFIDALSLSPVVFARICKPGKSVGKQFATRYYDTVNYGCLLYPEDMAESGNGGFAESLCIDHTSFLPSPGYEKQILGEDHSFSVRKDDIAVFEGCAVGISVIENAICEASARIYLRTGDLVAVELAPREVLAFRSRGNFHISGKFGEREILDFNVRYE